MKNHLKILPWWALNVRIVEVKTIELLVLAQQLPVSVNNYFGAVGNIVSSSRSKDNFEIKPVKYQCLDCKNKYEALPNEASSDDILKKPCTITFERLSSFIGVAVRQQVFLNGIKMGTIKNGSKLTFETNTRTNTIFVTDHHGVAFKGHYTFTAEEGGEKYIKFKKKFIK